jgi:hypothetical protein
MVLTWFAGVHGLTTGVANAMILREGRLPDLEAAARAAQSTLDMGDLVNYARAAELNALFAHARVTFPLAVAQALLGLLLVIASGLAMGGRPHARGLALQAIAANVGFAVLAYLLTGSVRAAQTDVAVSLMRTLSQPPPPSIVGGLWWLLRLKLVLLVDLFPLLVGALALTRARTRGFFEATAHAAEDPEDS